MIFPFFAASPFTGGQTDRRETLGKQAGNLAGIFGVQIIGEGFRIAWIIREHVPMAGDDQPGPQLAGQIG